MTDTQYNINKLQSLISDLLNKVNDSEIHEQLQQIEMYSNFIVEEYENEKDFGDGVFKYLSETKQLEKAEEFTLEYKAKKLKEQHKKEIDLLNGRGIKMSTSYMSPYQIEFLIEDKKHELNI